MIYYFTGQPGSGKTTLAKRMFEELQLEGYNAIHIDGDELRKLFTNTDYSEAGRRQNIQGAHNLIKFLDYKGFDVIVSFVSPFRDIRDKLKSELKVTEIYVHTTEIRGRESYHIDYYEPPMDNFFDIDTTAKTPDESFYELVDMI